MTLTDARLHDLVRHQRGALHDAGLLTDAEYAALAADHGAVARLEGYDAMRAERDEAHETVNACLSAVPVTTIAFGGDAPEYIRACFADVLADLATCRKALINAGNAAGARLSESCSTAFLALVQDEVRLVVRRLAEERDAALARVRELEATLANERGEGEPPSEGWIYHGGMWFNAAADVSVQRIDGGRGRADRWRGADGRTMYATAREAMGAALRGGGR